MKLFLILDVDGTLTDGGIYYDETGNELKKFCTRDAAGLFVAKAVGIKIIVITGRESNATQKRLDELGVTSVYQNVKNKSSWMKSWMIENEISSENIIYIGDDLNDLSSMRLCSYIGCPADACFEVKQIADYISPVFGGQGAVRDVIEHYLRSQGLWDEAVRKIYS